MPDIINVEILPDGRIKTTTSKISAANHRQADAALNLLAELMGGAVEEEPNKVRHGHAHHVATTHEEAHQ